MIKKYIEFIYPGFIVSETSEQEVNHRDPDKIKLPKSSFGFRFFDREIIEGESGKLHGSPFNYSGWFFKGNIRTIEQIKQTNPNTTLYRNMKRNNWSRVVNTEFGQMIPMEEEDSIIVGAEQ